MKHDLELTASLMMCVSCWYDELIYWIVRWLESMDWKMRNVNWS